MTLQRKTKEFLNAALEAGAQGRFGIGRGKRNFSLTHDGQTVRLMSDGEPTKAGSYVANLGMVLPPTPGLATKPILNGNSEYIRGKNGRLQRLRTWDNVKNVWSNYTAAGKRYYKAKTRNEVVVSVAVRIQGKNASTGRT